jgi:hypothetical protein
MEEIKLEQLKKTDLFAVMRLNETVEVNYYGQTHEIKIKGMKGFIPVFDKYEDAVKHSNNGKYQIIAIGLP